MAVIPALCRACGAAFGVANVIAGGGGATFSLRGNSYRPCPNCGGTADLLDGDFRLENDIATFLAGPQITRDVLRKLRDVIDQGQKARKPPEEILASAVAVAPGLSAFVSSKKGMAAVILMAILTTAVTDALKPVTELATKPIAAKIQSWVAPPRRTIARARLELPHGNPDRREAAEGEPTTYPEI